MSADERLTMVIDYCTKELARLDAQIERGKGTWPNSDYVTDDTWSRWHSQQSVHKRVLEIAGAP